MGIPKEKEKNVFIEWIKINISNTFSKIKSIKQ